MNIIKRFTLRLRKSTYDKILFIADINRRSLNGQIEFLIENSIKDYEKVNGEIKDKDIERLKSI